jgi:tetratricopeptide (TPR) repeat protein
MSLFGRKSPKKEIEDAKRTARENPSPMTTATLIQKYIDVELLDEALNAARYGLSLYPHSSSIQAAYRYVKRQTCADEIKTLKENILRNPRPNDMQRLAEIYYDIGEEDEAQRTAEDGTARFPDFEGNYIVLGRMRYDRWRDDSLPKDGLLAMQYLERAHELNRENYKTLMTLGQMYLMVGAKEAAEEKLTAILFLAPDDQRAREYLNTARNLPETTVDLDDLLQSYYEHRTGGDGGEVRTEGSDKTAKVNKNPRVLSEKLKKLETIPGFVGAVIIDPSEEVVATHFPRGGGDGLDYVANVSAIYKAAQTSSLRMDIGGFLRGYLECPQGLITMTKFEDLLFVIVGDRNAKTNKVVEELDRFLESTLYF